MQNLLRQKMGLGYTVHGFRSSFMDWVAEVHPQRLLEAERALDHQIGTQVQRAYLRTNFLDQRRELAELWTAFLTHQNPKLHPVIAPAQFWATIKQRALPPAGDLGMPGAMKLGTGR